MARKTRGSLVLSPSLSLARAVLLSLSPTFRPFPPPAHSFYPRRSSAATISSPFPFFLSFFFREASSSFPSFVSLLSLLSPPPYSSSLSLPFSRRSPPSPLPSRAVREQAGSNPYGTSLSSHSSSRFFLSPPIPLLFHLPRGVANLILRYIYFRNDPALYIYIYIFFRQLIFFSFFLSFNRTQDFLERRKRRILSLCSSVDRGARQRGSRTRRTTCTHTHGTGDPLSLGCPSSFSSRTGGRQAPDYADSEPPALRRRRRRRKKRRLGRKPAAGARRDAPRGRLDASGRGRTSRSGERRAATKKECSLVGRRSWRERGGGIEKEREQLISLWVGKGDGGREEEEDRRKKN